MALELHLHPLSSYCWKVLIALYEAGTPFTPVMVNLGDAAERAAYLRLSPFGKIPALRDTGRAMELFETTIIIEYLDRRYTDQNLNAQSLIELFTLLMARHPETRRFRIYGELVTRAGHSWAAPSRWSGCPRSARRGRRRRRRDRRTGSPG